MKFLILKSFFLLLLLLVISGLVFWGYQSWESSSFKVVNPANNISEENFLDSEKLENSILFTGDIMLDRGVEYQIEKRGNWFYPFERIGVFFNQFDMVVGNLEGPIVDSPPTFSDASLRFAFDPRVTKSLKEANFKILSLANNHTDNMGEEGWEETRNHLAENKIKAVGHPVTCGEEAINFEDPFVFLAFNQTFASNCQPAEIVKVTEETNKKYPAKFLVVMIHWGIEYASQSSIYQQSLAHQLIEAGADLIIGSHPHVVEEIEEYQGKLIFYSLGNFIFDQYFSTETQEGLVVGLDLYPEKVIYHLFPVREELSQPSLMLLEEKEEFLTELAQHSSASLVSQISQGKIEMAYSPSAREEEEGEEGEESSGNITFGDNVDLGPFPQLENQLVSHLYNIEGAPDVKSLAFSPNREEVWAALLLNPYRGLAIFNSQTGENLANLNLQNGGGVEVIFSSDGKRAYVSQMETGKIFEIEASLKKIQRSFDSQGTWTKVILLSPDEKTLFASNWVSNNISEIDLESGKLKRLISTVQTPRGIYLTPNQEYLYVAGFADGEIEKINLENGERKILLKSGGAMRHIVADEEKEILFLSDMGEDCVWKLDLANDQVTKFAETDHNPNTIVLSPDKKILFVSCRGINYSADDYYQPGPEWGSIILFDSETGEKLDAIIGGNQPTALVISPDGQKLFFSDFLDQRIEVYQIPDYQTFKEGEGGITAIYRNKLRK
jgi:DNA-binding beta-propeller fold protein YncE